MIRTVPLMLAALALLLTAPGASAETFDVDATQSNTFEPQELTIAAGDTVRWTATGGSHTVTSTDSLEDGERQPNGMFDHSISEGGSSEFTFDEPGTYHYYCKPHAGLGMTGTIIVEASDDEGGSASTSTSTEPSDPSSEGGNGDDTASSPAAGLGPLLIALVVLALARRS